MTEVIEVIVRAHWIGSPKKCYGAIHSAKLVPFVEQDIRITVERVLCPHCQHPLKNRTCPQHGKIEVQE